MVNGIAQAPFTGGTRSGTASPFEKGIHVESHKKDETGRHKTPDQVAGMCSVSVSRLITFRASRIRPSVACPASVGFISCLRSSVSISLRVRASSLSRAFAFCSGVVKRWNGTLRLARVLCGSASNAKAMRIFILSGTQSVQCSPLLGRDFSKASCMGVASSEARGWANLLNNVSITKMYASKASTRDSSSRSYARPTLALLSRWNPNRYGYDPERNVYLYHDDPPPKPAPEPLAPSTILQAAAAARKKSRKYVEPKKRSLGALLGVDDARR